MLPCIRLAGASSVLSVLILAGCGATLPMSIGEPEAIGATAAKLTQISDIPIPREARIDEPASLILGSGDRWVGRMVIRVKTNANETYHYYFNGMPRLGWTRLSAVQSQVSTLTFTHGERVATLQIEDALGAIGRVGDIGGAKVTIVVAVRQPDQP